MNDNFGSQTANDRQAPTGLLCPACRVDLVMSERAGVEIDYCPKCRGVWLDRGELDKIIARSDDDDDDRHERHEGSGHRPYKRKSFLHDLFD